MGGDDLFSTLKKKYNYHVPGFALFFASDLHSNVKALRVEAPDIGKEFSDGAYIGRDPEGFLYYNDIESFAQPNDPLKPSDDINYVVEKVTNPSDGKLLAHITFKRVGADDPHAEFLAEDPLGAVAAAGMDGWSKTGQWKPLTLGSVNATIYKRGDTHSMSVTVETIHKTATIPNTEDNLHGQLVQVDGILHFKDINTINQGVFANYNDDRIVFFQKDYTGTDFTAFFIPYEYSVNTLGYKPQSSVTALTFGSVSWS